MISRRRFLVTAAALPTIVAVRPAPAAAASLEIAVPPGLPAVYFHRLVRTDPTLAGHKLALRNWRDPGQLRTWVASSRISAAASPTNVAANLHNRGIRAGLLDVSIWGLLHVIIADGDGQGGLEQLRGTRVGIPFRDDMPDVVFRRLLRANGIEPGADFEAVYLGTPVEAAQMFLARRLDALVLPEPAATMVRHRSAGLGIRLAEIDLQRLWARQFDQEPGLPQAGTLALPTLTEDDPSLTEALSESIADAVGWVGSHPGAAAEAAADAVGLPASALAEAIERARVDYRPATVSRPALESFFERVAELEPDLIGGKLPDDTFYLA